MPEELELYDPLTPPDPDEWLAIDEGERLVIAQEFVESNEEVPNTYLHATFHVIVENQIALGDEMPVGSKLLQLMDEGLDRHDAIHAIGSVLAGHMWAGMKGADADADIQSGYLADLETLTAEKWLRSADGQDEPQRPHHSLPAKRRRKRARKRRKSG